MKISATLTTVLIVLLSCSLSLAQETIQLFDTTGNLLFQVSDEGQGGAIFLPELLIDPPNGENKLYNKDGLLRFNGGLVSPWIRNGIDVGFLNGKVGIGTFNPFKPLDVASPGGIRISLTDSISSNNEIFFEDFGQIRSSDDNHRIIFDRNSDIFEIREYGQIHFSTGSTSGERTSKMVIDSDGRVGIGTLNPNAPLDVAGNIFAGNILSGSILINGTDFASNTNEILFQDNGQIRSLNNDHRIIFDRENDIFEIREFGDVHISTGSTGERTSKMVVTSGGNVGIGTSAPNANLDVFGNAIVTGDVDVTGNTKVVGDRIELTKPSDPNHTLNFSSTGAAMDINASTDLYLNSDRNINLDANNPLGRVGVGAADPSERLDVNGKVRIREFDTVTTGSANIVSQGDGTLAIRQYQIGDFAHGGIVFWIDESGEHGLVCAKEDQSAGVRWYAGANGSTQAKGNGPYSGEMNTMIIIASQVAIGDDGNTYAARLCAELQITEGGKAYGDWYLPSREELGLMFDNQSVIGNTAAANGGSALVSAFYWSSTELNSGDAWSENSGIQVGNSSKSSTYRVRAIRAF